MGDLIGGQGLFGEKKEGMNLGHGAVDPPARAHFPPMQNELLRGGREFRHIRLSFLSRQKLEKYAE